MQVFRFEPGTRNCHRTAARLFWLWPVIWIGGCASVDPRSGYQEAADEIRSTTGAVAVYQPGEEGAIERRVSELLGEGVTLDEATLIALVNNREIQASFFKIGVAEADFVQAGLFSNPSLSAALGIPSGGGLVLLEAGLAQSIVDLWQIPVKRRVADRERDRAILTVARVASGVVLEVKRAYFEAGRARRLAEIVDENFEIARQLLELATAQREAGAANDVDVNAARSEVLRTEVEVRLARLRRDEAKAKLLTLLGLDVPMADIELVSPLTESLPTISAEQLLDIALKHRLDLRAAEQAVMAASERVASQRRYFVRVLEPGIAFEREARKAGEDQELTVGPTLDIELPIFDQNQAQIAKAEYEYQELRKQLEGLVITIKQNLSAAHRRSTAFHELSALYREEVLPQEQVALDLAQESYSAGATPFLSVLEAQRRFLVAREEYLNTQHALASALVDLEQSIGRPLGRSVPGQDVPQE